MELTFCCANCEWKTNTIEDVDELTDVVERVHPGDVMPDGQCPKCGMAVFLEDTAAERIRRAAPELLKALEEVVNVMTECGYVPLSCMPAARAAIQRAVGEQEESGIERARR